MTQRRLIKKLIVTSNLQGLSAGRFLQRTKGIATAVAANVGMIINITPLPPAVITKIEGLENLHELGIQMQITQKENTQLIEALTNEILDIITSQWAPQVQIAADGDIAKVKLLGFSVKGDESANIAMLTGRAEDSHPIINNIDTNTHQQHTLGIINSITGTRKLPADAKHTNVYMQVGGLTAPTDYKKMEYAGIAQKGKFVTDFENADIGKTVYYVAVYIDKISLKALEYSPLMTAMIN